ncbi:MAG: class I SAM-dependent methyltransferase [Candidatus Eisenbacteria bacterium]|nr:class I SAM-dependent methyltransferase [Candidatus Eisenbacteria bacterium]
MPTTPNPAGVPAPASFIAAARAALERTPDGVDPWFHRYLGEHLLDDGMLRTWVRAKQQLMDLVGGVQGKVVVDGGSGFGMVSNLLAAWGAERVWSVEVHEPMVRSHMLVNREHFPDFATRVIPVRGDVAHLPLRTGSADLVMSIEAISHYYDVDHFLDECARVLKPGGHVVISDGNNGANPATRTHTEELWERFEHGPMGMFGDHEVPEPMVSRRERVIRERFPALAPEVVSALAERTSGMDRAQIHEVVGAHLAGGPAPDSRYHRGQCPREPEWGYYLEQLFDPRDLAARLEKRGFEARALPHFGGAANDLVNTVNSVLRAFPTFRWARAYRVAARKK